MLLLVKGNPTQAPDTLKQIPRPSCPKRLAPSEQFRTSFKRARKPERAPAEAWLSVCFPYRLIQIWKALQTEDVLEWEDSIILNQDPLQSDSKNKMLFSRTSHYAAAGHTQYQWDMVWTYFFKKGTPAAPKELLVRYQKTKTHGGLGRFMPTWKGSAFFVQTSAQITAVKMYTLLKASGQGKKETLESLTELLGRIAETIREENF